MTTWAKDMLLLIDNYDSFTYNLVHYLGELGVDVVVRRNDAIDVQEAMAMNPAGIMLSPGPCDPAQAGICLALTAAAAETKTPLIGVCLGHQTIGRGIWWQSCSRGRNRARQDGHDAPHWQRAVRRPANPI